ncbi:MAG: S8 family serine peptidase, partial [Clostridium sp.]
DKLLSGALVNVIYTTVVAKSNRAKGLFSKGSLKANKSIVGAKFIGNEKKQHVITHYVSMDILNYSIKKINTCITKVKGEYDGIITNEDIERINKKQVQYNDKLIAKTNFLNIIVDAHYIETLAIPDERENIKENSIVTIYKTDEKTAVLMDKLGIRILPTRIIDETTMLLTPEQLELLKDKAPYLISMAVSDLSTLTREDFFTTEDDILKISKPSNEPTIGVIDTMFDKRVYFSEWVEFKNMLSPEIELTPEDYFHGTSVSSIVVDGPTINPRLDDGCGNFRVRHFGVATSRNFSSFTVLRAIKEIIASNKDIKVWNLSLGSILEINPNFISAEAAILDRI